MTSPYILGIKLFMNQFSKMLAVIRAGLENTLLTGDFLLRKDRGFVALTLLKAIFSIVLMHLQNLKMLNVLFIFFDLIMKHHQRERK